MRANRKYPSSIFVTILFLCVTIFPLVTDLIPTSQASERNEGESSSPVREDDTPSTETFRIWFWVEIGFDDGSHAEKQRLLPGISHQLQTDWKPISIVANRHRDAGITSQVSNLHESHHSLGDFCVHLPVREGSLANWGGGASRRGGHYDVALGEGLIEMAAETGAQPLCVNIVVGLQVPYQL